MTPTDRPNIPRLFFGGLAAGLVINAMEYLVHGMFLDAQWTAAFAALGKTPTGWTTFIPANFLVGIIAIWIYTRLKPSYAAQVPKRLFALRLQCGWSSGLSPKRLSSR